MNNFTTRRKMLAICGGIVLGSEVRAAPTVVNLVVPYAAGGPSDVVARQLVPLLRRTLDLPVVVQNVPGASGALAVRAVLEGASSSLQILVGTPSETVLAPLFLPQPTHRPEQLKLLGVLARAPLVLVGPTSSRLGVDKSLLSDMREAGRALACGNIGHGSLYHLAAEDLARRTGINLVHVPYRGVAPLLQELIGGTLDLALLPIAGNLKSLLAEGKLRAHAIADRAQVEVLKGVPTVTEALQVSEFVYENWVGLFVSNAVPGELVQWLHSGVREAQMDMGFRSQIEAAGSIIGRPMPVEQLQMYFNNQAATFTQLSQRMRQSGS